MNLMNRREFIKAMGVGATCLAMGQFSTIAEAGQSENEAKIKHKRTDDSAGLSHERWSL